MKMDENMQTTKNHAEFLKLFASYVAEKAIRNFIFKPVDSSDFYKDSCLSIIAYLTDGNKSFPEKYLLIQA